MSLESRAEHGLQSVAASLTGVLAHPPAVEELVSPIRRE